MHESSSSTTLTETAEQASKSPRLRSLSILSSPRSARQAASQSSKIYKQASTLYLTRRFPEAWVLLESLTTTPKSLDGSSQEDTVNLTPIRNASRNTRIKLWSLYLTLLDAIIELGPEDGRLAFGGKEWRAIRAKAQDGTIWEDVIRAGYGGNEGHVDAEIVINLATLLLGQSPTQNVNQQHLETYLSATNQANIDLTNQSGNNADTAENSKYPSSQNNGAGTPCDLNARIQILELYTLHVLPRNQEWAYARDFIKMSEVLDDDRREVFLQALHELETEQSRNHESETDLEWERDQNSERQRQIVEPESFQDEIMRTRAEQLKPEREHRRTDSEQDYGIESPRPLSADGKAHASSKKTSGTAHRNGSQLSPMSRSPPQRSGKGSKNGMLKHSQVIIAALQRLLSNMAQSMSKNPLSVLRMVLFLLGIVLAMSRNDVKDRIKRITGEGWDKVRRTVGMGVKVSYI